MDLGDLDFIFLESDLSMELKEKEVFLDYFKDFIDFFSSPFLNTFIPEDIEEMNRIDSRRDIYLSDLDIFFNSLILKNSFIEQSIFEYNCNISEKNLVIFYDNSFDKKKKCLNNY